VAFRPTGVWISDAASTPAADSRAPIRTGRRGTSTATTRLVTIARTASVRLMFIQPPSPNRAAVNASGIAAGTATSRPPTQRPDASSATPARPRNNPATGLVADASSAAITAAQRSFG
jgi:hypothetical protein